eukprot:3110213-Rhodomonas_salina.1
MEFNLEYTAVANVSDDYAAGLDYTVFVYGTPICRDTERMAELQRLDANWTDWWSYPTGFDCRPIFAP